MSDPTPPRDKSSYSKEETAKYKLDCKMRDEISRVIGKMENRSFNDEHPHAAAHYVISTKMPHQKILEVLRYMQDISSRIKAPGPYFTGSMKKIAGEMGIKLFKSS